MDKFAVKIKPHDCIEIKEYPNYKLHIIKTPHLDIETTFYILETAKEVFFIDSGVPSGKNIMMKALENIDLEGKKKILLNTHEHWDHMGLNDYIQSLGAFAGCHIYGRRGIQDKEFGFRSMFSCFFDLLPLPENKYESYNERAGGFSRADFYFKDGEIFEGEGIEIEVVHTPGHSASCCCFYERNSKALFTGDSIQGTGYYYNLPFLMTATGYEDSLKRMLNYNIEYIYGGHEIMEGSAAVKEYLAASANTLVKIENKVKEMFDKLPLNDMNERDFAKAVAEDMGKKYNFQAFHCVHAVVEKLRQGQ